MSRPKQGVLAVALVGVGLTLGQAPATAIVPPSDCGRMTVKERRYDVKADQLRCTTVRTHARRYLTSHVKPTGYRCKDYGAQTKLEFRCAKGVRVFFAIRR